MMHSDRKSDRTLRCDGSGLDGWTSRHEVQFYGDDHALCVGVARFLADAIRGGQPVIVIATPAHRKEFAKQLRRLGIEPDRLSVRDSLWLDARETVSAFMEGPHPNAELFQATVGSVFDKVLAGSGGRSARAYGEMVDLLWREAKSEAALKVERYWNDLARTHRFALRCAYSKESLMAHARPDAVEMICRQHSAVLPSSATR